MDLRDPTKELLGVVEIKAEIPENMKEAIEESERVAEKPIRVEGIGCTLDHVTRVRR